MTGKTCRACAGIVTTALSRAGRRVAVGLIEAVIYEDILMPLVNDLPEQASSVLEGFPHNMAIVLVLGLDEHGDMYVDTNTDCPHCQQHMLFAALGRLKESLD